MNPDTLAFLVGPGYGGEMQTYGGGKRTRDALSRQFLDPSERERASGLLRRGFLYRKNRALTPEGVENVPYEGGPKPLFGRGVIREVSLPPLSPPPHWRPLI